MAEEKQSPESNTLELRRGNADELIVKLLAEIRNAITKDCQLHEQTQVLLTELLNQPLRVQGGEKVENG
ncbi:MAG: hypothetical protein DRH08_10580 [Deltaproteobacteria bacterium]|nr:MAG: hypothetical protein DRH08_10580 [Deltaproteobacteria bacterium]